MPTSKAQILTPKVKTIDTRILEMMAQIKVMGHKPDKILLDHDDYNELVKIVNKQITLDNEYVIEGNSVKWNKNAAFSGVTNYLGLPVYQNAITAVGWGD